MTVNVELTTKSGSTAFFQFANGSGTLIDPYIPVLPFGAATAAKQPTLGVAGTASTDVLTVQGIANMSPILTSINQVLGNPLSATNPIFSQLTNGTAVISASNGLHIQPSTAAIFTTNPSYFNGTAISATNAPYTRLTDGTAAISNANPLPTTQVSRSNSTVQVETALTSSGSSTPRQLGLAGYSKGSYQVDISNVGVNVIVRVEGNNDGGTGWANLTGDQTVTSDGTYLYSFDGVMVGYVRLTVVSINSGSPTITPKLLRGN